MSLHLRCSRVSEQSQPTISHHMKILVDALSSVLAAVFDHVPADPRRLAVAGFSDGASYALTLGLANGELFPHILAFSAGFFVPARRQGWPAIFVSHGRSDPVLPIDMCGRRVVEALGM